MDITLNEDSLSIIKALASETRIQIIELLSSKKMNISELSKLIGLSNAVIGRHINILEKAGILKVETVPAKSGTQKMIILKVDTVHIHFPQKLYKAYETIQQTIPIGHFSDFEIKPTCGLATLKETIGPFDDPRYFMDPRKQDAAILWFTSGFIEYKVPNLLSSDHKLEVLDLNMELSSEFPYAKNNWLSDIDFYINDVHVGQWTSPGDFADTRGKYTPAWWSNKVNQYGILVTVRVTTMGTYINGQPVSEVGIHDIINEETSMWEIKLAVDDQAEHVGGLTLFGKGFGNHDQDILLTSYYSSK